jgi:hypothetical protein
MLQKLPQSAENKSNIDECKFLEARCQFQTFVCPKFWSEKSIEKFK